MVALGNDWDELLKDEFRKEYYLLLRQFLKREYRTRTIYPDMYKIYEALRLTSYKDCKVVILGQDPYHGPGQAHGLAFSVPEGIAIPPSLLNIFKELESDLGCNIPNNGCLVPWARQGVLLLNTSLTVVAGQANSHRNKGWEILTDRIIQLLNEKETLLFHGAIMQRVRKNILQTADILCLSQCIPALSADRGFLAAATSPGQMSFCRNRAGADRLVIPNI